MKNIPLSVHATRIVISVLTIFAVASCKSADLHSLSDLQTFDDATEFAHQVDVSEDCLAWNIVLMTTLYAMIRPAAITAKRAEIAKNKHEDFDYYLRTLNKIHTLVDMHETLPPDVVKKVIGTIIEREGGQCSKKVLYETSCLMHPDRGEGMLHAVSVLG